MERIVKINMETQKMTNRLPSHKPHRAITAIQNKLSIRIFVLGLSIPLFAAILFWSQSLWAASEPINMNEDPAVQQDAADFIQTLADRALTSLNQKELSLLDQEGLFQGILNDGFDVNYIGKISLGRHRKKSSKDNLNIYYDLLPDYLVKIYTIRLTKLDTKEVRVGKVLPNGKRDMYVRTVIVNSEEKTYDVDWRVRPKRSDDETDVSYKIIDVKIEGISMARTQRDDFAARISSSGMSGLIDFMQAIVDDAVEVAEDNATN